MKVVLSESQAAQADELRRIGERRYGDTPVLLGQINRDTDGTHLSVIPIPQSAARALRALLEKQRQKIAGQSSPSPATKRTTAGAQEQHHAH